MIQNPVALQACKSITEEVPVWLDIGEIMRNALGFPVEMLDARAAIQDYVAEGRLVVDPLAALPPLVAELVEGLAAHRNETGADIGIDCASVCEPALLVELYRLGFRKFSVAMARHNEVRLLLGQLASE